MSKRIPKNLRKKRIQRIADKVICYLKEELPNIEIDFIYTNKQIVSRYININLPNVNNPYQIRISDHVNCKEKTYDYNFVVRYEEHFKLCSTIMHMVVMIKRAGGIF